MAIADGLGILIVLGGLVLILVVASRLLGSADHPKGNSRLLREHARLTAKAAKASRRGHTGEANIYQEAADRLLDWQEHDQLR